MSHGLWAQSPSLSTCVPPPASADPAPVSTDSASLSRLTRTVTRSVSAGIDATIGTAFSSLHPDREWIVVDAWLRTTGTSSLEIGRDEIGLRLENGSWIGLPNRDEVAVEISNIGRTLIAASAEPDQPAAFFPPGAPVDRIPFVTRSLVDTIVLAPGRVSAGKLLFHSPRRSLRGARFSFEVRTREVRVSIPFSLPADAWPDRAGETGGRIDGRRA